MNRRFPISPMLLVVALAYPVAGNAAPPGRHALLIGIERYSETSPDWQNLDGPVNDVRLIREILVRRFNFEAASVRMLENEEATASRIRDAFADLCGRVAPGDVVYIHYSGHGSRVHDANGDEGTNGFDSSLVPIDSRRRGGTEILDDEIRVWLSRMAPKAAHLILVVDACHSGTITRGGGALKVRGAPTRDTGDYGWSRKLLPELAEADGIMREPHPFVRISACLDPEWANEYAAPDGKTYGFLTWNLAQALMSAEPGQSWESVFRSTEASMSAAFRDRQHPRFEGSALMPVFGAQFSRPPRQIAVLDARGSVLRLRGGLLDGVTPGSIFHRVEAGGDSSRIEILATTAFESTARLTSGVVPTPGQLFDEREHRFPFRALRVRIRSAEPHTETWSGRLSASVGKVPGLDLIEIGVPDILLTLERDHRSTAPGALVCRVLDGLEQPYGNGSIDPALLDTPIVLPADTDRVARKLSLVLCNRTLLKFAAEFERQRPEIRIEVLRMAEPAGTGDRDVCILEGKPWRYETLVPGPEPLALPVKTKVAFRIWNDSALPVYAYFINLTPDGHIVSIFPGRAGSDDMARVPSGGVSNWGNPWGVELTDSGFLDTYLCFLSESPAPLWNFDTPGLDDLEQTTRGDSGAPRFDYNSLRSILETGQDPAEALNTRGAGGTGRISPQGKTAVRTVVFHVQP